MMNDSPDRFNAPKAAISEGKPLGNSVAIKGKGPKHRKRFGPLIQASLLFSVEQDAWRSVPGSTAKSSFAIRPGPVSIVQTTDREPGDHPSGI